MVRRLVGKMCLVGMVSGFRFGWVWRVGRIYKGVNGGMRNYRGGRRSVKGRN